MKYINMSDICGMCKITENNWYLEKPELDNVRYNLATNTAPTDSGVPSLGAVMS